jgi:hypothetical protein
MQDAPAGRYMQAREYRRVVQELDTLKRVLADFKEWLLDVQAGTPQPQPAAGSKKRFESGELTGIHGTLRVVLAELDRALKGDPR